MPKYEGTITPKNNRRIEPIRGNTQVMLDQLNDTRPGEHNIMVYPDLQTLNEVMANHYKTAIENRNELALFVTYYQPIQQVRQVLSQEGLDVAKYEKEGSLVIYDSVKGYQSSESVYPIMALINMLVYRVKKLNKSGMFGMADMGSFFLYERIERLLSYELSLPSVWDKMMKLRSFCLYHERDFKLLNEEEKQALIDDHYRFIKPY